MEKYKIQAVVVTYNRKEMLCKCIENLLLQSYQLTSVLIVNNNSTDGTYDLLKEKGILENPRVNYICLEKNIGGAGGFHEGMKRTFFGNYDFAWIMDDDVFPEEHCLEELVNAWGRIDEKLSFVASRVMGPGGEAMNVPEIDCRPDGNGYENWMEYLEKSYIKIKSATFVSLLIPMDAVKECGLPIKDYFIWGDDTEYTTRLTTYYGNAYYIGTSKCVHNRAVARALSLYEEMDKNRLGNYYYHVRNSLINAKLYKGTSVYHKYVRDNIKSMFAVLLKSKHKHCRKEKAAVLFRGTRDAVFGNYDINEVQNRRSTPKE